MVSGSSGIFLASALVALGCGPAPAATVPGAEAETNGAEARPPMHPTLAPAERASGGPGPRVRADEAWGIRATRGLVYGQALSRRSMEDAAPRRVDLRLHVYEPEGASGPRPAAVCFRGGGFSGSVTEPGGPVVYSDQALVPFARYLVSRGFVAVTVEYRMEDDHGHSPPGWPGPEPDFNPVWHRCFYPAVRDGKAALRWLHANAERFAISPDHIGVVGGSAGAGIGIALGLSDPADFTAEFSLEADPTLATTHLEARSDVRSVVSFWGPTVPVDALQRFDGRSRYDAGDASFTIVHGLRDTIIPFEFARSLEAGLAGAGVPHRLHAFDGLHAAWAIEIEGRTLPELTFDALVEGLGLVVD